MAKLHRIKDDRNGEEIYLFECPGYGNAHLIRVKGKIRFLKDCHHKLAG